METLNSLIEEFAPIIKFAITGYTIVRSCIAAITIVVAIIIFKECLSAFSDHKRRWK